MPHPADFPEGYEPRHELGQGSMGHVWLAWHPASQGHCAIKILNLRNNRKGSAERSFNREVRAMARLSHPSVVQVYDYGRTPNGAPFMAVEYVPGESLHAFTPGSWTWPQLWGLLDGLLAGLGHAHARAMIHRDLKPGNVLIQGDRAGPGAIKLVDFGIALAVCEAAQASRRIEGTPAYIAPEAASGTVAAIGPWTDLYSLGVILFEILTGDLPFRGRNLLAHHQHSPMPPVVIRPDVEAPAGIIPIVERLMQKSPVVRYRSVADVREALQALGPLPEPAPMGSPPSLSSWADEPETIDEPIQPVAGPTGAALVHLRRPTLVGREAAQKTLKDAAEAAIAGHGPRVVIVEADAGMGKSRLASELKEWLEENGLMRTLMIRSEPQTTGGGLLQSILRFIGAPNATRQEADEILPLAFPDPAVRQSVRAVLWPHDAPGGALGEGLVPRAAHVVGHLAEQRPFLLWADDAQWSPEGRVLQLAHRIARDPEHKHLLVIVTLRPSTRATVLAARKRLLQLRHTKLIRLGPIPPMELAPALESLGPLPPGLAEAAALQAAGIPLIALEAVRSYLEAEGMGAAPADPNTVLEARIDHLTSGPRGGELRSALARTTLLGRSFTAEPLARLCAVPGDPEAPDLPADPARIEALLERAVQGGLLLEQGPNRWRYSHDLIRAQLRQLCQKLPNWPALNREAARIKNARAQTDPTGIEIEVVARHHWEGGDRGRALRVGLRGAERLHTSGLMGHAASFARRLLEWDDRCQQLGADERGELRLLASDAAEHSGQPVEAERHATEAVKLARRNYLPGLGCRAASRMGMLKLQNHEIEAAETWLWDALRFARRSEDPKARSNTQLYLGRFYQHRGEPNLGQTAFEVALELAREGELLAEELAARLALARIERLEGDVDRAAETFEELIQLALESGLEVAALEAKLQLGLCAWLDGDPVAARSAFEDVRTGARGNLFAMEFQACLGEAWSLAMERKWTDAEMVLMQAEDLRFDVRLRDDETERLRQSIRTLAAEAHRPDIVLRVDRLHGTRTRTTHASTHA